MKQVAQVRAAEVIANRRTGVHHHLTLVAPEIAEHARPGQFLMVAVGDLEGEHLLRRPLWIHKVSPSGTYGGTVDVVVTPAGPGTAWLSERRAHDTVDVLGPLGRPFLLPADPVATVLVGGGHGIAPLLWLARRLKDRGCPTDMVLTARADAELFGVVEARRSVDVVETCPEDGIDTVLGRLLAEGRAAVAYACGSRRLLESVSTIAASHGIAAQVALEQPMACGIGACAGCALPVRGTDGVSRLILSCVDGPVLRSDLIRWDALSDDGFTVPADTAGADAMQVS